MRQHLYLLIFIFIFIDETDSKDPNKRERCWRHTLKDPNKRERCWRHTLKTMAPQGLNVEDD